jgi:TRAP-type C4-dicarboxylate transport system substrate-binding protein
MGQVGGLSGMARGTLRAKKTTARKREKPMIVRSFRRPAAAALLAALATAVALPAGAQSWDMPTPYGDSVFHTRNVQAFADAVAEATDLDITVHSAGSLYAHPEIKDAVRRGLAPIGEVLMSRLANEDPIFAVDSIPFLASSYEEARALWEASRPLVEERLAAQGLTLLYAVPWPGQSLYTQEPLETTADLEGASFRAYNAATERLAQLMGAVPTQIETGDIPTAFATGRVDAMITSPSTGVSSQAWDYTSHFTDTQAWLPKNMVIANSAMLDGLEGATRQALMDAAAEAETRGWEMSASETESGIATLRENGMTVSEPTEALSDALAEIGETMTQEWLDEAGDAGAQVIDAYENAM